MLNEAVNVALIAMFTGTYMVCHAMLAPEHFEQYIYSPTIEQWESFKSEQKAKN